MERSPVMQTIAINVQDEAIKYTLDDNVSDIENDKVLIGFKWTRDFGAPTYGNWQTWKMNWSNFIMELACKHVKELQHLLRHSGPDLPLTIQGVEYRPDFHTFDTNGKVTIFEFKSMLFMPTLETLRRKRDKISPYTVHDVIFVPVVANDELPDKLGLKPSLARYFRNRRKEYEEYIISNPTILNRKKHKYREIYSSMETVMEASRFTLFPGSEGIREFKTSIEDIAYRTFQNLKPTEEMLDREKLDLEKLPSIYLYPDQLNIFPEHPLNRDKNRIKTLSMVGNTKDPENYGHRAVQLMPYWIGNSTLKEEDIESVSTGERVVDSLLNALTKTKPLLKTLSNFQQYKALVQTDSQIAVFNEINSKLGTRSLNRKNLFEEIDGMAKSEIKKYYLNSGESFSSLRNLWKIKKTGLFRAVNTEMIEYLHLGRSAEKTEKTKFKKYADCAAVNKTHFDRYIKDFDVIDMEIPWKNINESAYDFNDSLSGMLKLLKSECGQTLVDLFNRPEIRMFYKNMKFFRGLILGVPIFNKKGKRTNDFHIDFNKELNCICIGSVNPNDMTTGVIKTIQLLDSDEAKKLIEDNPWGEFHHGGEYKGKTLVISAWFRLNMAFVSEFEMLFSAYMANQLLWQSQTGTFLNNSLYMSLFFNYSRQLAWVMDLIYFALSRGSADLSFGKTDMTNKFKKLKMKDLRASALLVNFNLYWGPFYTKFENVRDSGDFGSGIKDPFFREPLKHLNNLLFFTYAKNFNMKNDGDDSAKILWGFFQGDIDQQRWWDDSPYNPKNNKNVWNMNIEEFHDVLFKEDGTWQKISYCAEAIQGCFNALYDNIKDKIKKDALSGVATTGVTENLKTSKVKVPTSWGISGGTNAVPDTIPGEKKVEGNATGLLKGEHRGLVGVDLSEAYNYLVVEYHANAEKWEKELSKNLGKPVIIKRHTEPTQMEMALFLQWKYPKFAILTPEKKDQVGGGKRQFYEQAANSQIPNRVKDMQYVQFLKACNYDMIQIPGDEKLPELEKIMKQVRELTKMKRVTYVPGDMQLWGDLFTLEGLTLLAFSAWRKGMFSKESYLFTNECNYNMSKRIHLVPRATNHLLIAAESGGKVINGKHDSYTMQNIIMKINEVISVDRLKLDSMAGDWGDFTEVMKHNYGFQKSIGMALGTDNSSTTVMACLQQHLVVVMMKMVSKDLITRSKVHSDDSINITALPRIKNSDWHDEDLEVDSLIESVLSGKERRIDYVNGFIKEKGYKGRKWDLRVVTKLYIITLILTARYFGMRPSLGKFFVGPFGEVLQIAFDDKGRTEVPIVRYSSKLGANLPGKSYSTDLVNMISRTLPLILHGGSTELIHNLQVLCNNFCYWRFGLDVRNLNWNLPTQLGGGFYALPTDLIDLGFDANLFRLMAMAQKNATLMRVMKILLMTEEMWELRNKTRQSQIKAKSEEFKADNYNENEPFAKVTFDVSTEGERMVGDTFLDCKIVWSRSVKTLKTFALQCDLYRDYLSKEFQRVQNIRVSERSIQRAVDEIEELEVDLITRGGKINSALIKQVVAATTEMALYKALTFEMKLSRHLNKYTTLLFQESRFKQPAMIKLKNRLGYPKRLLYTPYKNQDLFSERDKIMTINEFWKSILELAQGEFVIPNENENMWNFLFKIYEEPINLMLNTNYRFAMVYRAPSDYEEMRSREQYMELRRSYNSLTFVYTDYIIGYVIEKYIRKREDMEMELYNAKPWLMFDERFHSEKDQFIRLLDLAGISYEQIEGNVEILRRILKPNVNRFVMRATSENLREALLTDRCSLRFKLIVNADLSPRSNIVVARSKNPLSEELYFGSIQALATKMVYDLPDIKSINTRNEVFSFETSDVLDWSGTTGTFQSQKAAEILFTSYGSSGELDNLDICYSECTTMFELIKEEDYLEVYNAWELKEAETGVPIYELITRLIYVRIDRVQTIVGFDRNNKFALLTDMGRWSAVTLSIQIAYILIKEYPPNRLWEGLIQVERSNYNLTPEGEVALQAGKLAIGNLETDVFEMWRNDKSAWGEKGWTINNSLKAIGNQSFINNENVEVKIPFVLTPWINIFKFNDVILNLKNGGTFGRYKEGNALFGIYQEVTADIKERSKMLMSVDLDNEGVLRSLVETFEKFEVSNTNFGFCKKIIDKLAKTSLNVVKEELMYFQTKDGEMIERVKTIVKETATLEENITRLCQKSQDVQTEFRRVTIWYHLLIRVNFITVLPIGRINMGFSLEADDGFPLTQLYRGDIGSAFKGFIDTILNPEDEEEMTIFTFSPEELAFMEEILKVTTGKGKEGKNRSIVLEKITKLMDDMYDTGDIEGLRQLNRVVRKDLWSNKKNNFKQGFYKALISVMVWDDMLIEILEIMDSNFLFRSYADGYFVTSIWRPHLKFANKELLELLKF